MPISLWVFPFLLAQTIKKSLLVMITQYFKIFSLALLFLCSCATSIAQQGSPNGSYVYEPGFNNPQVVKDNNGTTVVVTGTDSRFGPMSKKVCNDELRTLFLRNNVPNTLYISGSRVNFKNPDPTFSFKYEDGGILAEPSYAAAGMSKYYATKALASGGLVLSLFMDYGNGYFLTCDFNFRRAEAITSGSTNNLYYSHGSYSGQVFNGRADGRGTYFSKSGMTYTGDFSNDTFNGSGVMQWPNGAKYIGRWQNDMGIQGTMYYPNGNTAYGVVKNAVFYPN
jgi:hypothetical protein